MITTIFEFKNPNYAYHVGDLKHKTDYIGDKLYHIKNMSFLNSSRTGHFGAGYYFFGKLEDALQYQKKAKRNIVMIDFSLYNLYKPEDAEDFVESVIGLTDYLTDMTEDDYLKDSKSGKFDKFIEDLTEDLNHFKINLSKENVKLILKGYLSDLFKQDNPKSDYIITRFLKACKFDGIDFRNTKYDNFYLGSVLYNIKSDIIEYKNNI